MLTRQVVPFGPRVSLLALPPPCGWALPCRLLLPPPPGVRRCPRGSRPLAAAGLDLPRLRLLQPLHKLSVGAGPGGRGSGGRGPAHAPITWTLRFRRMSCWRFALACRWRMSLGTDG